LVSKYLPCIISPLDFPSNIKRDDISFLGFKAVGLLKIPKEWVPPFIILTKSFYEIVNIKKADEALKFLPLKDINLFKNFLKLMSASFSRILVRSNAPTAEYLSISGEYLTIVTSTDLDKVTEAIDQVCRSDLSRPVFAILQKCIEPAMLGHMSNERRVSNKKSVWLVESISNRKPVRISIKNKINCDTLVANDINKTLEALRLVAYYLSKKEQGYFHCEWAWDGKKVWIVQADPIPPIIFTEAINKYIRESSKDTITFKPKISDLCHFLNSKNGKWKKLYRPIKFHNLGLPYADVYVLTGCNWNKSKLQNYKNLLPDLFILCQKPVIIRSDISEFIQNEDIFLPTSPPTTDPTKIIEFMENIAEYFVKQKIDIENWAFLLANLIPAQASAMVHAKPEAEIIQIDALWGYPDGLSYYPHNTYFYWMNGKIKEIKRYKSFCIMCMKEKWDTLPINPPLDWGEILSRSEVELLAKWALKIANDIEDEVQFMVLTRINGLRGKDGCLPWHFNQFKIPHHIYESNPVEKLGLKNIIRSIQDLEKLKILGKSEKLNGFTIQPEPEMLRNPEFLEEAAKFAFRYDIPIYFEGSLLGHAYYQMVKTGARVIALEEVHAPIELKKYDKIVRDLIPTIIHRAGGFAHVRTLNVDEAKILLVQKLIEESYEAWQSKNNNDLLSELADILEIINALKELMKVTDEELENIRRKKKEKRGGFQNLIYLEETINQNFELIGTDPNKIPLFFEEDLMSIIKPVKSNSSDKQYNLIKFDKDSKEMFKIEIPLIPPIKGGLKMNKLNIRIKNFDIRIAYENTRLEFTMSLAEKEAPIDQLPLFE